MFLDTSLFAPTNAAFEKLLGELGIGAEDLLNHPQLADVLTYHVVSGKVMSTDLSDGMEAKTLNESSLKFDLSSGVMISDSNVISADIEAQNGVVHVIDKVMIPDNFTVQEVQADETLPKTGLIELTPIIGISTMILLAAIFIKKKVYG